MNGASVSGDAGSDLLLFSSTISFCPHSWWFWWRQHALQVLLPAPLDYGADNDTLTLSVAATSTTILGGAGDDTLVFTISADLVSSSMSGGGDDDSSSSQLQLRATPPFLVEVAQTPWSSTAALVAPQSASEEVGADSVSFRTRFRAIAWGGSTGTQTVVFSDAGDAVTFTRGFGGGFISLGCW